MIRRRDLLPIWMKFFVWVFLILAGISIIIKLIFLFTGLSFGTKEVSIYGMETFDRFSFLGFFITFLLLLKVVTAFAMWTEKKWAIDIGITDAVIGIIVCGFIMFETFLNSSEDSKFSFRFEIIFLIFYLLKCLKINETWKQTKKYVAIPNQQKIRSSKILFSNENFTSKEKIEEVKFEENISSNKIDRENDEDYLNKYKPK